MPERLVPAYRWRSEPSGFAGERLTREWILLMLRLLDQQYSSGPIMGKAGIGAERWAEIAERHGLAASYQTVLLVTRELGTSWQMLVREAVGAHSAVIRGRLRPQSRQDVVWSMAEAIRDGFVFGAGWGSRALEFGRDKPYSFNTTTIYGWAAAHAGGDVGCLIAEADLEASLPPVA